MPFDKQPSTAAAQAPRSFRATLAAMLGICLAFSLIALNTSVVGTALPLIVADLRGYRLYQWAASAFLLGNAVMIPITGRLGDLYGRKHFVLAAVLLFALASLACGASHSMLQLVLARGLQGLAGGMLLGVAPACVPDLFPDAYQRVRWQVMLSSTYGVALAIGPSLGGWLAEHVGWRYVFYINLPVALVAALMVGAFFPHMVHHEETDRSIDWLGVLLLVLSVGGLLMSAQYSQEHGFADLVSLGAWALTGSLGWAFFRHQYRTTAPIIPPRLLDDSGARKLMLLGILTGLTMFMLVFYTPLLLQGSFAQTPNEAGLVMTPLLVCITIGSILNARLLPRLRRAERLVAWGQLGMAVGCLLLLLIEADTARHWMLLVFTVCGLSLGFQLPNLTLQIMAVAGGANMGVAAALAQSTRTIGSMVGVGVASVLVNHLYAQQVAAALGRLPVHDAALTALLASPQILIRQQDQSALRELTQRLGIASEPLLDAARQGLVSGTHAAFLLCALISGLSIFISLRLPHYSIRARRSGNQAPRQAGPK
ncbi:MAG: MFS transporter [Rhodoferax sp.]